MALPILPESEILGAAFSLLQQEMFYHNEIEDQLIKKLRYIIKRHGSLDKRDFQCFLQRMQQTMVQRHFIKL